MSGSSKSLVVHAVLTAVLLTILVALAVLLDKFPDQQLGVISATILLAIIANLLTIPTSKIITSLYHRLKSRRQQAREILSSIHSELANLDKSSHKTGRFRFGYEHAIFSPEVLTQIDAFIASNKNSLQTSTVDDHSSEEAALLTLFAGYDESVSRLLENKFADTAVPELTRLAEKGCSNTTFQKIVLALALGQLFPGRASEVVRRLYNANHRIYYGDWVSQSRLNLSRVLSATTRDECIITFHIGNSFRPSDVFAKLEAPMRRLDFQFIHPCILSRGSLRLLEAELGGPAMLKREVGFLATSSGNYNIDFVRKVFQLLDNVREIVHWSEENELVTTRLFFYLRRLPSLCVQIVRDAGYLFLIPAAFDNAKFLSKFTMQVMDKGIASEFADLVTAEVRVLDGRREKLWRQQASVHSRGYPLVGLGDNLEEFEVTKESLESLIEKSIAELSIFLRLHGVSSDELRAVWSALVLALPPNVAFYRYLFERLLSEYEALKLAVSNAD